MKKLFTILFAILLSSACFAGDLDLGDGFLAYPQLLVTASNPAGITGIASNSTIYLENIPDDYDKNSEWSGATFTAAVDEVVLVRYSGYLTSTSINQVGFIKPTKFIGTTDVNGASTPFSSYVSAFNANWFSGNRVFNLKAGQKISFAIFCQSLNGTISAFIGELSFWRLK